MMRVAERCISREHAYFTAEDENEKDVMSVYLSVGNGWIAVVYAGRFSQTGGFATADEARGYAIERVRRVPRYVDAVFTSLPDTH